MATVAASQNHRLGSPAQDPNIDPPVGEFFEAGYTHDEHSEHSGRVSCWVDIDDLSLYDHPGRDLRNCGSDIAGDFYPAHDT